MKKSILLVSLNLDGWNGWGIEEEEMCVGLQSPVGDRTMFCRLI